MVQLVRQHSAAAASTASSTHKRRGEDDMQPSPTRQRALRNASQEEVTKEMIDDTLTDLMAREWGVPLHILRGDGLAQFCRLVAVYPGTYTPPSCEHMRTVLVPKVMAPYGSCQAMHSYDSYDSTMHSYDSQLL
ncbi:hypothetical protein QJQ45_001436 [Haematococcus lacustris]|nr:hypothetical protein QJQ45_001435 [Haematococcus lacustris]KAJ9508986.1 hypothetical protein QJQ45_001436 [Haematococcus lacustris]